MALLAFLPHHRIRQTYLRSAQAIAAAGLGEDWAAFRRALAAIRKAGYAISHEQIAPGLGGVAVPILLPDDGALVGSLAWSFPIERMDPDAEARWARELARVAAEIAREYVAQAGRPRTSGPRGPCRSGAGRRAASGAPGRRPCADATAWIP